MRWPQVVCNIEIFTAASLIANAHRFCPLSFRSLCQPKCWPLRTCNIENTKHICVYLCVCACVCSCIIYHIGAAVGVAHVFTDHRMRIVGIVVLCHCHSTFQQAMGKTLAAATSSFPSLCNGGSDGCSPTFAQYNLQFTIYHLQFLIRTIACLFNFSALLYTFFSALSCIPDHLHTKMGCCERFALAFL